MDGVLVLLPEAGHQPLQLPLQVRDEDEQQEGPPVLLLGQPGGGRGWPLAASQRYPLQAVEVFGEGGAAGGQVVLLEQQVQDGVRLVEPAPQPAQPPGVGLGQHLQREHGAGMELEAARGVTGTTDKSPPWFGAGCLQAESASRVGQKR